MGFFIIKTFFLELLFYYNKVVIFVETNRENMETLNAKDKEQLENLRTIHNIIQVYDTSKNNITKITWMFQLII